jgi:hypothetical protein
MNAMRRARPDEPRTTAHSVAIVVTVGLVTALVGCTPPADRSMIRYLDPEGLFATDLPEANDLTVIPPDPGDGTQRILSGVSSAPPQGGDGLAVPSRFQQQPDVAQWSVFVIESDPAPASPSEVTDLLTTAPNVTVDERDTIGASDRTWSWVVGEIAVDTGTFGFAAAGTVDDDLGYLVVEYFPSGDWPTQEQDFGDVVDSFTTGPPPGTGTLDDAAA